MPSGHTHHRLSAAVIAGLAVVCVVFGLAGAGSAATVGPHECGQTHSTRFAAVTADTSQPAFHQSAGNPTAGTGWRTSTDTAPAATPTTDERPQASAPVCHPVLRPAQPSLPVRILFGVWLN